jgi:hypothetical protein
MEEIQDLGDNQIITANNLVDTSDDIIDLSDNIVDIIDNIIEPIDNIVEPIDNILDLSNNILEQTLIDFLKIAIINSDIKDKISIKLTPDNINVINNIITLSPNSFKDINKSINRIIVDSKIDSKDIPSLILIIQLLYRLIYSLKNVKMDGNKRAESTSTILKFIIHLLVLERKIVIDDDKQDIFFSNVDMLIDTSSELLSLSKSLKTKGCLKKMFS